MNNIVVKAAIQFFKTKLNNGKIHRQYKDVKSVALLCKKFQVVTICHALCVDINGVGFVGLTIVIDISIH